MSIQVRFIVTVAHSGVEKNYEGREASDIDASIERWLQYLWRRIKQCKEQGNPFILPSLKGSALVLVDPADVIGIEAEHVLATS